MKKINLTIGIFLAGILCVNAQSKPIAKPKHPLILGSIHARDSIKSKKSDYDKACHDNKIKYAKNPSELKKANEKAYMTYQSHLISMLDPTIVHKKNTTPVLQKNSISK